MRGVEDWIVNDFCRTCSRYRREAEDWRYYGRAREGESYRLVTSEVTRGPSLQVVCSGCGCWTGFDYCDFREEIGFVASRTPPRSFKAMLFARFPSHVARHLYDRLRAARHREIQERGWEQYFDGDELRWLERKLASLEKESGVSFVDNRRVAQKNKPRQVRRYKKQQADGCCGSFDTEVTRLTLRGLKTYLIGFNYGH